MKAYLALLRGINVGGNNIIKMDALKACFEKLGFTNVRTFIQSGNVIFSASENATTLCLNIEKTLSKTFGYKASIVLLSHADLKKTIASAPKGFGLAPTKYRYDVIFVKKPLTSKKAIAEIPIKEGVDEVYAGNGAIFFSRLIKDITKSKISRIVMLPLYKQVTIRNWNTTSKLLTLMEDSYAKRKT